MKENKAESTAQNSLLKIFSTVLRDRSKSEQQFQTITPEMVKFFTRKKLIEIVTHNFNGNVSQYNLVEMENEEILLLIGDDYRIISYVMSRWSKEISQLPTKQEWLDAKINSIREPAPASDSQVSAEGISQENLNTTSESDTTKNQEANGTVSENQITNTTATQQFVETEGNTNAEGSESPKSSDKKLLEKKQEETPSSKKPEKAKNT
ncbi:hypothetical protein HIO71_12090 [Chryseobacterium aquaticum]|uniref:Uncharacterized protein n=1 Tax=Chryseobacterium aquaticum TaxID=452084 RepID=A0A848N3I7_9FLAO|nr:MULTISPECIES: hypothetical protein [Chryseobacterium]NMR34926.1 hypothetical protein [Chryseobacterium aquaticum]NRQ47210.1 hypothetical protein [Chryseobacterium sp. C-204]